MNIDIAMGVIEEIARRLGVPVEQIIPELSKMSIAHHAFMCVVMSIAFLILLAGIIVCVKKQDDYYSKLFPNVKKFLNKFKFSLLKTIWLFKTRAEIGN